MSEPELVRHYVRLSRRNFDLDSGFYPLGSCTMKHNPRLHERVTSLSGHARLHPLQDPRRAQGALELMYNLERALGEVAGLPHVCLQPSAGSHGELAGVLVTRAYHEARGEHRTKVLAPDTSHGTNPATVTMAGYEVVPVKTSATGGVDLDDLRAKADDQVACLMLTNPNTLGVFDPNIEEIAKIVHEVGATLYYDGANLNAVMGISRPGDMGFDIVHYNLHKSFTQPHGGGGPGSGPIAVSDRIAPYLPVPVIQKLEDGSFDLVDAPTEGPGSASIGKLRGFQGNYGCFVRSYAYICSLGGPGLQDASETAVLNANYLLARLQELVGDQLPLAFGERCMHEFVLSGTPMKRDLGIRILDLAKRLLDHGYHPPTVYFRSWSTRRSSSSRRRRRRRRRSTPSPRPSPTSSPRPVRIPRSRRMRRTPRRFAGSTRRRLPSGPSPVNRWTVNRGSPTAAPQRRRVPRSSSPGRPVMSGSASGRTCAGTRRPQ